VSLIGEKGITAAISVSASAIFIPQGAADFAAFRFDTYTVWEVLD